MRFCSEGLGVFDAFIFSFHEIFWRQKWDKISADDRIISNETTKKFKALLRHIEDVKAAQPVS